jgi:DNA polymerase-3 subunit beta
MRFSIQREALLEPLQIVSSVVERRQTLPVLSNLLLSATADRLKLTGTDQEVELSSSVSDLEVQQEGEVTVPARKLFEIWRSLSAGSRVELALDGPRLGVSSGRFKSHLATLPAEEFPTVEMEQGTSRLELKAIDLARLLDKCSFAMAQQDVRYFFNGMLFEIGEGVLRTVATNGQRLATSTIDVDTSESPAGQFIIPRKGIVELARLVPSDDTEVVLDFTANHMRAQCGETRMTSKLIDAAYPDYNRAIPGGGDKQLIGARQEIREALGRTAILSNEMYKNVRLQLDDGKLSIHANNPLQEEAEESVNVEYQGGSLEIGFNVGYLIDALNVMSGERVQMVMSDANSAALVTDLDDENSRFVVSPMML